LNLRSARLAMKVSRYKFVNLGSLRTNNPMSGFFNIRSFALGIPRESVSGEEEPFLFFQTN
jgi:hypothetical protein